MRGCAEKDEDDGAGSSVPVQSRNVTVIRSSGAEPKGEKKKKVYSSIGRQTMCVLG
jgi:hypothetical protein